MKRHPDRRNESSRRQFLATGAAAVSAAILLPGSRLCAATEETSSLPIVLFSKVYQELNLNMQEAADLTAEAGLQGLDSPVRPGGEILPENAAQDLPRYAELLGKHRLTLPLLTTAITGVSTPHTEDILRTAKKLGVQYYRLGFAERRESGAEQQLREIKAQLKDLAELNREVGIGAIFQNHSPSGHAYVGGDLREMREIVSGFDPAQIGVAFDIGHALVVHRERWREQFEALKSHLKIAYVKDVTAEGKWVPLGQGQIGKTDYFKELRRLPYRAPVCLHVEYDWSDGGKSKNRPTLLKALKDNAAVLKDWLRS